MAEKSKRVIYLTGYSARKGLLGITAFPEILDQEAEFTRFYTTMNNKWLQQEFDFDIRSVTYLNQPEKKYKGWWLVGKGGEVVEIVKGKPKIFYIETAGTGPGKKYGNLFQIRTIGNELFICGHGRQVYQRKDERWHLISADILDKRKKEPAEWFRSIDGFSASDLYAAGSEGEIWHFNGKKWHQCHSPVKEHLTDIRCIRDRVWICGAGGVVLCGREDKWEVIWNEQEPVERWWNIEGFQNKIYLADNRFIGLIKGSKIIPVKTGIKKKFTSGTLHHKEGILWSIGAKDILAYDGKKWKEIICPDNK